LFPAVRVRRASLCTVLFAASARAASAQTPVPAPTPLPQDLLTLQGRSSVVQGSGARALGMGGAFLARADDATAASWNPAGLSYLRLPEVSFVYAGGRVNSEETNFLTGEHTADRRRGDGPDFAAATYPLHIGPVAGAAQLSFQRQISFNTDRTIDEDLSPGGDTDGTAFTRRTTISSRGGFDVLALGSGWQVTSRLRLGATLNRWLNGYDQISDRPVELGTTHQEFHYGFRGWNVNLGAIWTPMEMLNVGLVYKSGFKADLEINKLRRDPFVDGDEVVVRERTANSDDIGLQPSLDFPAAFGFGASLRPRSALTVSVDYTRTRWSTQYRCWERTASCAWTGAVIREFFDLPKTAAPNVFEAPLPYPTLDVSVPQKDTEQIRAGLEYVLIRGRLRLPLRVGYFNDRQYFRAITEDSLGAGSPRLTAPRFDGWTAGAGIVLGRVLFDAAYVYERGRYIDLQSTAVHDKSHRVVASIIYRHGPR
jgi:long-subunit fatty acid transport protein